jgi:hypothetical protein
VQTVVVTTTVVGVSNRALRRAKRLKPSWVQSVGGSTSAVVSDVDGGQLVAGLGNEVGVEISRVAVLRHLTSTIDQAEKRIRVEVRKARRAGVTWQEIGEGLGMTQQGASKRFGPYPVKKA